MPALQALLLPAGIALFIALVFAVIPAIEPLQNKLEGSAPLLRASWIATLALMVVLQGFVSAPIFGASPGPGVIIVLVGLLFVVLGNMLPKSRPGFFVGIRTPWTITDADNWIATHRLGGKLFLLAGLAMILVGLLDIPSEARVFVVLGSTIAAAAIPMVYSWWLWRSGRVERG